MWRDLAVQIQAYTMAIDAHSGTFSEPLTDEQEAAHEKIQGLVQQIIALQGKRATFRRRVAIDLLCREVIKTAETYMRRYDITIPSPPSQ
jgi:hypothetical protein